MSRDSLQRPIEELADSLRRFMRVRELRLLCIEVQERLRAPAIQTVLGFEHSADNRSPLFPLAVKSAQDTDRGWADATQGLRELFEAQREAGSPLGELAESVGKRRFASADFSVQLLQCAGAVRPPAEGLLLVVLVESAQIDAHWLDRLRELATVAQLAAVRFVLVTPPCADIEPWLQRFPKATAVHHQCELDESAAVTELSLELEGEVSRGAGFGGAWPKGVQPPPIPRRRRSTLAPSVPPPSGSATESTPAPSNRDPEGDEAPDADPRASLEALVKRAALSMRSGDGPEAIRHQAEARDLCLKRGDIPEAVRMETMLGAYMAQLGQPRLAAEVLEKAARRAYDVGEHDLAAQAFVAQGSVHDTEGNAKGAVRAYRHAIDSGSDAARPQIVLEAYWRAGQTALQTGLELDCIALYADAVAYAAEQPPQDVRGSRAKDIADELCGLLSKHRRYSEARTVERTAEKFSGAGPR